MSSPHSSASSDPFVLAPETLARIQNQFHQNWEKLLEDARQNRFEPLRDRRFSHPSWSEDAQFALMARAYLLSVQTLREMVDSAQIGVAMRERLRFAIMQWADAMAPSNFLAFNPEAQASIIASAGEAIGAGVGNLLHDLQQGRITQTDESEFEVGRNLAVTPGSVVYENALFQLIQYAPATPTVHRVPLLMVPPNINKFYVLDLQPANSFVGHAVAAGFTVFLVSWRNPTPRDSDDVDQATWSDYLDDAVLRAITVTREISGCKQINALGFCVGGTMLAAALALARARDESPVAALTLLTTLLDFRDTGVLSVFVDETHALLRERAIGNGGLMWGRELATTFSFLRPNELVWNYVVLNYLKGQTPPPFDLLYWNADATNLPGPFFAWYFRNTYLENRLSLPGAAEASGVGLDLSALDMPTYIFGSREDHIVPWPSAYATTQLIRGTRRFVLGASGHVAGVINPPEKRRRSYWSVPVGNAAEFPLDPQSWLNASEENPGSWWPDWHAWLATHSGAKSRARPVLGNKAYPPIEPAPGRYVKVRV